MNAFDGADFTRLLCELLRGGHSVRFQAKGGSMQPTILDGEILIAEPVSTLDLQRNEIVLYALDEKVISHRIQEIQGHHTAGPGPTFLARGDANGDFDRPVEAR